MMLLFLLLTLAGCILFYLTHPHQNWLKTSLKPAPWRLIAAAAVLGGLLAAVSYLPVNAALFAWLVIMMLVIGLLPFAPLLKSNSEGQGEHG